MVKTPRRSNAVVPPSAGTAPTNVIKPNARIDVKAGTRLKLRIDCPMDFDLTQVAGPRLALGGRRFSTGSTRVIVFRKVGVYKFVAQNVQTSAEAGLATLGTDNVPRLTIRVR